ncbi:MAG: phosphoglucosamine mutase, partial [Ruminococcus sp.]|nr:phosphoglucosamine mutase [Ruminococcus sp.]
LRNNSILVTQANNMGLIRFARENGIGTAAAPTGERGMMRRMLECGFSIGGDPSGHIIFPDDMPAADGQLTGIRLLEAMKAAEKKMSELAEIIEKCPQVMLNVPIENKYREVWKNNRTITSMIDEFESILGDEGRVIVRETGAEPVIRIRIEGRDFSAINTMALSLADTIKEQLSEE